MASKLQLNLLSVGLHIFKGDELKIPLMGEFNRVDILNIKERK